MTYTMPIQFAGKEIKAEPGYYVMPDEWPFAGQLVQADEFDQQYFGTQFRIKTGQELIPTLPVKIKVTGRVVRVLESNDYRVRVQVEFCRDCEPSVFVGGYMFIPRH